MAERRTLLVTGAGGFLGARIVRAALAAAWRVVATGRAAEPPPRLAALRDAPELVWARVDATEEGALAAVGEAHRPAAIVHAAAAGVLRRAPVTLGEAIRFNTASAIEVARAAAASGAAAIWVGSSAEYAARRGPCAEDDALLPSSEYGFAKVLGWRTFEFAARAGPPRATLRMFHLYGPGEDRTRLVPAALLAAAGTGENRFGDPAMVRDFVFVDDAADAVVTAASRLAAGSLASGAVVNVATGRGTALAELTARAAAVVGAPGFRARFTGAPPLAGYDPPVTLGDAARASALLGWTARTPLEAGLAAAWRAIQEETT